MARGWVSALRAVLFDFDGVLVNSEPLHFYAFRAVLAEEGIELTEDQYYDELLGFDDAGAFRHVYARLEKHLDPRTFLRLMTLKGERMLSSIRRNEYSGLPGANALVRALVWQYPLAIVSGARREEIEATLEGVGLRDCFPTLIAAEDVTQGKPHPEGYLRAATVVGARLLPPLEPRPLHPEECLVVEDSPTVIANAKAAGFRTLAVTSSVDAASLSDADAVVGSLEPRHVRKALPGIKLREG